MKNTILKPLLFIALVLSVFGSSKIYSQDRKVAKATKDFDKMEYVNAQKIYLAVAEKGYGSEELFTKLAESYYFNAQYDAAVKWYARLFELAPSPEKTISKLRYSQALKATGENKQAENYYESYREDVGETANLKPAIDYANLIEQNSGRYQIQTVAGLYGDDKISFGHTKKDDALVFSSTENQKPTFLNRKSGWDGLSYLSLYTVNLDSTNQTTGKAQKLKGNLNSVYHESSAVYTKDLNTMYFTRSNNTAKKSKDDTKLKIYRTQKKDNKWTVPEELNFNSDHYTSAHPALSPDEKTLYFSSDRPGGFGESDLYRVSINKDGTLGTPENLGAKINTPGKETFPFIDADNGLYFSSDGHFGLGGLDVFYIKIEENKQYGNLLNVGAPINSYADDFAFGIEKDKGFISSNRSKDIGAFVYDNIYTFVETQPITDVYKAIIEGVVTDKQTNKPLNNASIVIKDSENNQYAIVETDENGYYKVEINRYEIYTIIASKENYDTDDKQSKASVATQKIDFELQQNEIALVPGVDLAKVLNIPIIYFDFDKSNIRKDAQVDLEKVLIVLQEHENLRINIRSHTDSRGNSNYNQSLSQRRAVSTMNYLVSKGIDSRRLTFEGLGESELVNNCGDNEQCSEVEHQENRRSEFIVID